MAFCAVDALQTGTPAYLDVAIVLALINFLSTLALARFAERALDRRRDHPTLPAERLDHVTETHSPEGSPPETRP